MFSSLFKLCKRVFSHPISIISVGTFLVMVVLSLMTDVVFGFKQGTCTQQNEIKSVISENDFLIQSPTPFFPLPTNTATPTLTSSPTITSSPTPTYTSTPFPISAENLPESAEIAGLIGHAQYYTLDCETRSAVDWAEFFGYSISELDFLENLPLSDNPEKGFVGNFWDAPGSIPPLSYGVHAEPIARLLREYEVPAIAIKGMTWNEMQLEIAQRRPVIAWVIYQIGYSQAVTYTSSDGDSTLVAPYEHTVIVAGYDSGQVIVIDGNLNYSVPLEQFLQSWSSLGNMAIVVE
jgi:uncharacterized protein YvpB